MCWRGLIKAQGVIWLWRPVVMAWHIFQFCYLCIWGVWVDSAGVLVRLTHNGFFFLLHTWAGRKKPDKNFPAGERRPVLGTLRWGGLKCFQTVAASAQSSCPTYFHSQLMKCSKQYTAERMNRCWGNEWESLHATLEHNNLLSHFMTVGAEYWHAERGFS